MQEQKQRVMISASLNADTVERLKTLAYDSGSTMTEVINRAVELESFLHKVTRDGGRILIEDADGAIQQVLRD